MCRDVIADCSWLLVCTGTVAKKELSERDIKLTVDLFQQLKPHQIYAAGDLSDPHGTHRTCLQVNCLGNQSAASC